MIFTDFQELFRDKPILLQELLCKHYLEDQLGCINRAYMEYYVLMMNKECTLLDFYDIEDLEYLRIEPEANTILDLTKDFFINNKFIFKQVIDNDENLSFEKQIGDKKLKFYILQNSGTSGDYECCASIILRYVLK